MNANFVKWSCGCIGIQLASDAPGIPGEGDPLRWTIKICDSSDAPSCQIGLRRQCVAGKACANCGESYPCSVVNNRRAYRPEIVYRHYQTTVEKPFTPLTDDEIGQLPEELGKLVADGHNYHELRTLLRFAVKED